MAGVREVFIISSPPSMLRTAAVAIMVRGHSELTPMPSLRSSSAKPNVVRDIPYFAIVYPSEAPGQRGLRFSGGDSVRMCGLRPALADLRRWGIESFDSRKL